MKSVFYISIAGLILFEIANVFFIMPMQGSQRMDSLDWAYHLYQNRWFLRGIFGVLICVGLLPAFRASKWKPAVALVALLGIQYLINFEMSADHMFYQPRSLRMADAASNTVNPEKLVLGIEHNGQAKAYPIQFMGYHHQVQDTVGGAPVMVTYCTVCRTGRVFSPTVNGKPETFRLVGMDHFNAMFEDATTQSWWRQATGEAVAGSLKGVTLPELASTQTSLKTWLELYPNSLIMQRDDSFSAEYDSMDTYDIGLGRGALTGTDTTSWKEKSWVVGVALDKKTAKAFDWNRLKQERIIQETVGNHPIVLILGSDQTSFAAFKHPKPGSVIKLENDTLILDAERWDLLGRAIKPTEQSLSKVPAYQEFWHSWQTFHPSTSGEPR